MLPGRRCFMKTGRILLASILTLCILFADPHSGILLAARCAEATDVSAKAIERASSDDTEDLADPQENAAEGDPFESEEESDRQDEETSEGSAEDAAAEEEGSEEGEAAAAEESSEEGEADAEDFAEHEDASASDTETEIAAEDLTGNESASAAITNTEVADPALEAEIKKLPAAGSLIVEEANYTVRISYDETAEIPEGAELTVKEVPADEKAYEERQSQIEETLDDGQSINQALLLDIKIMADGKEVEPAEGSKVKLEITTAPEVLGTGSSAGADASSDIWEDDKTYTMGQDSEAIVLYHFPDQEEAPVLMEEAEVTEDSKGRITASVETESFSDYEAAVIGGNRTLRIGDSITIDESDNHYNRSNHSWTVSNPNVIAIGYDRANQGGEYGSDLWTGGKSYATITAVGTGTATLTHSYFSYGQWRTETMNFTVNNKPGIDASGRGDVLPTIDNKRAGIYLLDIIDLDTTPLNLLDERNNVTSKPYDVGVNVGHQLKLLGWGAVTTGANNGINDYTGGSNADRIPKQKIVQDQLQGGYPSLRAANGVNEESLSYLFDGSGSNTQLYSVNKLFKETASGYFEFDSDHNFATLNPDGSGIGNKFTVYSTTFAQDKHAEMPIGFFPFMPYDKNEAKGSVNMNKNLEHHFAMHMESNFVIPATGKDADGNDIIFEFSGDDDMWVFIDDQLVLDIGGVHQPVYGSINFRTGAVEVQNGNSSNLPSSFIKNDEQNHTMKIFYMERGGCDSNCKITFNMPIKRPIIISKTVDGKNASSYYNEPFSFKIMMETQTGSGQFEPYTGGLFPVGTDEDEKTTPSVIPDADGVYTLKHGDEFETLGIIDTRRYYVQEINVDGTKFGETDIHYDTVTVDDNGVRIITTDQSKVNNSYGQNYSAECAREFIKHRGRVDFTNKPVVNQITVQKFWEAPPDLTHGTVKVALFKMNGSNLQMVEGTVRDISYDQTTNSWKVTYYLFDSPDQYQVRELKADGRTPVDPNGRLKIEGEVYNGQTVVNHYTVTYDQGTPDAQTGDRTDTIYNTIKKKVRLVKLDENGQNLKDAVFTLQDSEGTSVGTYTSGEDGLIVETVLKAGTYYLEETTAPTVYAKLPERIVITVTGQEVTAVGETSGKVYQAVHTGSEETNNELFAFSIPNAKKSASLTVIKKSSTDQTKLLPGAAFKVYTDSACTQAAVVYTDTIGTVGDVFTTGDDGKITIYGLTFGETYYLKEVTAPNGYYVLSYPIKVVIGTDGTAVPAFVEENGSVVESEAFRVSNVYTRETMNNDLTVLDSPVYDLPSAGGPGTFLFTIIGTAVMAAIILLYLPDRRKT